MTLVFESLLLLAGAFISSSSAARSSGCGLDLPAAQQPAGGASHQTNFTQSDGTARTYLIHIPSNYDKNTPVPLIFSFHGHSRTSASQEALSQFSNEEWNPNGIAVYPQGIDDSWQGAPYAQEGVDNIGFVHDMINYFNDRYCIDTTRIYAAGKSNGGGFCGTLACDPTLSTLIAAFAPVSGAFYVLDSSGSSCSPTSIPLSCSPGRLPIPILEFHGSSDTTIPYSGEGKSGACLPSIPHWVREWSKRDGYGISNQTAQLYGGEVQRYEYGASAGKLGIVTSYLTDGLGHAWPSTEANSDNSQGTYYNATPLIMDFFGKYSL